MKTICLLLSSIVLSTISGLALAATLYVAVSDNLRDKSFSAGDIKRILLGEMAVVNNARLNVIYPSYSSPEIETLSQFVGKGKSVRNLKSYWSKMIFTGRAIPPLTANNQAEFNSLIHKDNSIGVCSDNAGLNVIYTINE